MVQDRNARPGDSKAIAQIHVDVWRSAQTPLAIPDRAIKYILFQRADYLRLPVTFLYRHAFRRLPWPFPIYNAAVAIESRLDVSRIKRLYRADMVREYRSIKDALPPACAAVLDIGCGVAAIDVLLDRHYSGQRPEFYLLDRTRVDRSVYYLYEQNAAFYNSLDVARELMMSNGIFNERVHLLEAYDAYEIPIDRPIDLAISLLAWGFHFPVEMYAEQVHGLLSDSGVVILDVRRGTEGLDVLRKLFPTVEVIVESKKYQRVSARKRR